jgi:arylsulfatase
VFEHVALGERTVCVSKRALPVGDCDLKCSIGHHSDRSADVRLFANGRLLATGLIPRTLLHLSFWGIDVGRDRAGSVSHAYTGEFPFSPSVLESVTLNFSESYHLEDLAEEVEGVE